MTPGSEPLKTVEEVCAAIVRACSTVSTKVQCTWRHLTAALGFPRALQVAALQNYTVAAGSFVNISMGQGQEEGAEQALRYELGCCCHPVLSFSSVCLVNHFVLAL